MIESPWGAERLSAHTHSTSLYLLVIAAPIWFRGTLIGSTCSIALSFVLCFRGSLFGSTCSIRLLSMQGHLLCFTCLVFLRRVSEALFLAARALSLCKNSPEASFLVFLSIFALPRCYFIHGYTCLDFIEASTCPQAHTVFLAEQCTQTFVRG